MEGPGKNIEPTQERIPTRQEIVAAISEHVEGHTFVRELFDEKGIYLYEVETPGLKKGEVLEYQYLRAGGDGLHNTADKTCISVTYYEDSIPVFAERIAVLDEATGAWRKI